MFAFAPASGVSLRQARTYAQVDVATGVDGASPHGLIVMLFDGLLGVLAEARGAIRQRDIAAKGRAIGRAVRIIDEGLTAALNMEDGGTLAGHLERLYGYIGLRLTHANLHNDEAALEECTRLVETLRGAWTQIADRAPA
ncbi:MAG TPA: flagellar export chaperone FliS [Burkholderiaceae bacterium]|nr:flagellar export chaperone FliS [Burkholderiaceae bacterium]